jgi:Uncharacterised protein family (UPF0160)
MIHTILTHPGGAHKDDLLAVCVLIAKYGVPVVRRTPTATELDDPEVAVVDVGDVHAVELANFDHHHFPREHPPTCSLSLVLDSMGLYQDALNFCDWLEPAEWFDSRGPNKTAQWLGVPRRAVSQLNSPVDITLLRRFAQQTELDAGDTLYEFMRMVGQDLLDYLGLVRQRIAFVETHAQPWSLAHGDEVIQAVFLPRTDPLPEEPSAAVGNYIRASGLASTIAAVVYPDRRGVGFGIGRYEDHPQLDFTRVEDQGDVRFAHKSGFMCKTVATDPKRLQELIRMSWLSR